MDDDHFKIYIDQLRDGEMENLSEEFTPEFLDVNEQDLKFVDPVHLHGEAYLAEDMLMLHLDIETNCIIPCSICNEPVKVPIEISGFYHAVPLEEIKGGIFHFQETLREIILLNVPILAECKLGKCPQRSTLQKYFKPESSPDSKEGDDDGYRPFANLDLDQIK
ncbi:MAG: hypothetical protein H0X29_00375 [Parachlamydiaceae bacterium]|nr:hypothetical protein [Parachlamydiaceae bacterium]